MKRIAGGMGVGLANKRNRCVELGTEQREQQTQTAQPVSSTFLAETWQPWAGSNANRKRSGASQQLGSGVSGRAMVTTGANARQQQTTRQQSPDIVDGDGGASVTTRRKLQPTNNRPDDRRPEQTNKLTSNSGADWREP
jgi:hypothetical protein